MPFDITNRATHAGEFIPQQRFLITDATGNSPAQDAGYPCRNWRAYVRATSFTEGDASTTSAFALEVSNVSNFASNVETLDVVLLTPASLSGLPSFTLAGMAQGTDRRYARVSVALGTNAAVNYDAIVEAAP